MAKMMASCEPMIPPTGGVGKSGMVDRVGPKAEGSKSFQSGPIPKAEHQGAHQPFGPVGKPSLGPPTSPNGRKRTEVKG